MEATAASYHADTHTLTLNGVNYRPALEVARESYSRDLNRTVEQALKNCWAITSQKAGSGLPFHGITRIKPSKEYLATCSENPEGKINATRWKNTYHTKKRPGRFGADQQRRVSVLLKSIEQYAHPVEELRVHHIDLTLRQFIKFVKPLEKMESPQVKPISFESPSLKRKKGGSRRALKTLDASPIKQVEVWAGLSHKHIKFALLADDYQKGGRLVTDLLTMQVRWASQDPVNQNCGSSEILLDHDASDGIGDSRTRDKNNLESLADHPKLSSPQELRHAFEAPPRHSVSLQNGSPPAQVKKKAKGDMMDWVIRRSNGVQRTEGYQPYLISETAQLKAVRRVVEMLAGLARARMVHGDIKLDNMLVTRRATLPNLPDFALNDLSGSFLEDEYPFETISFGKCLGTHSPDRLNASDVTQITQLLGIRNTIGSDPITFVRHVSGLFQTDALLQGIAELRLDCAAPEHKSSVSDFVSQGRILSWNGIQCNQELENLLQSKASSTDLKWQLEQIKAWANSAVCKQEGMALLRERCLQIHRKRDVFAAGIELYGMFTGEVPLVQSYLKHQQGYTTNSVKAEKANRDKLSLKGVHPLINKMILTMLNPDYTQRPNAHELQLKFQVIEQALSS